MLNIRQVAVYLQLFALTVWSLVVAAEEDLVLAESSNWSIYGERHYLTDVHWSIPLVLRPTRFNVFLEHRSFNFTDGFPCNLIVLTGPGSLPTRFCAVVATGLPLGRAFWLEKLVGYVGGEFHFRLMWEDKDVEENGTVVVTSMVGYANIPIASYMNSLGGWDWVDTEEEVEMASNGTHDNVSLFT